MRRILWLVVCLWLGACGRTSLQDLRDGLPTREMVQISLPTNSSKAVEGTSKQALTGETAFFYGITRKATLSVNGGTAAVLTLVRDITEYPPSSFHGNVAVWGPFTDPLSPSTYRLTVTDHGKHRYGYVLEGKAKQDPDTSFRILLSGSHLATTDSKGHPMKGFGYGSFLVDWDQINALPLTDGSVGAGAFTYSRTPGGQVEIDVTFTQVMDQETHQRIDANYRYLAAPNADGKFEFSTYRLPKGSGPAERLAIESRWKLTGAGRSDVIVSGSVSPAPTISECWDQFFKSAFLRVSYDHSQDYGSESDCAFSPAEYPVL